MARNKYPEVTVGRILDVATGLFLEKGYEQTTIQDIINALGDLSKGAIYHHFKSKEEIIKAAVDRLFDNVDRMFSEILNDKGLTGLQKLKKIFRFSVENSSQEKVMNFMPNLLQNPKFLAIQLQSTIYEVAPQFIEPIIKQGIADGSIKTEYPKELAEVVMLLSNIWINPLVFSCTKEELYNKCMFFRKLLVSLNLDLFDDELINSINRLATNGN